ncbi:serine protease inhibitor 42Dd-like isoform X2 [Teleopsis dalmanni]|uniref:serine protease inhibitor 42Dd-like isoform X2 n=1 Tax=Teleopsis dalmanni TaxID=139649 RepID=UPI0018CFD908|nr:serine protease inhibitor 42Dd-like isoform X2 [Teleopsis dalmanni]
MILWPRRWLQLFISLIILYQAHTFDSDFNENMSSKNNLGHFGIHMYNKIGAIRPSDNIVFSPFSIQTCTAMARLGAEGETAEEMDRGLGLPKKQEEWIGTFHDTLDFYKNSEILHIANKIYVMNGFKINIDYNEILKTKFFTSAEEINFASGSESAHIINKWIESKTNNLIKDMIPASGLSSDTRLLLLNAVHFKGNWQHKFEITKTRLENFYIDDGVSVQVQMMSQKNRFRYADLPDLNATAIELPYKKCDLSMLIILPKSVTGLKALEEALLNKPISDITKELSFQEVVVKIPKWKAEFSIELNEPFKQLGMSRMFTNYAEFGKMLENSEPLLVSKVLHKAFIEVNELGTEAAAATGMLMRKKRGIVNFSEPISFIADHPYYYFINHMPLVNVDEQEISPIPIFVGSVKTFDNVQSIESHDEL